jgi:hypothetical protein
MIAIVGVLQLITHATRATSNAATTAVAEPAIVMPPDVPGGT